MVHFLLTSIVPGFTTDHPGSPPQA